MSLLPPERRPLEDFVAKHVDAVNQQKAAFKAAIVTQQGIDGTELDNARVDYAEQRPGSLESSLKSAYQKAQAFKAAVDIASDAVQEETGCDKDYCKEIIVSPEALVSRYKSLLQGQISELEDLVGKEERGLDTTKNEPCEATVQAEYTNELNQQALTQLPTFKYYAEEVGSEVAKRNALIDTYEKLRKDLTAEDDFEATSSTAAMSMKVKGASVAVEASKAALFEKLNTDFQDLGRYHSELTEGQIELLENAFQKIENGDSLNTLDLNELIGLLNASHIRSQKAASLEYYLRFQTLSNYVASQKHKFKKGKNGDTQLLRKVVHFAKALGFDEELRVFGTVLSEDTILDVIAYVEKALNNDVFRISDKLAQELEQTAEVLSSKFDKGATKKLSKSQSQFDDLVQNKVKELLESDMSIDVKQLADVEHDCAEVGEYYKIKNTALFTAYNAQKDVVEEVLKSLQGAEPTFFLDFKGALGKKNEAVQAFEVQLAQVNADLDTALGNTSGEHTYASVDQKLGALRNLIDQKHAEITQKRDEKRALTAKLRGARDLTEITSKSDIEALFKAKLEYDFAAKREELQSAVNAAESELNVLNQAVLEQAKEVINAGPKRTAAEKEHVVGKNKIYRATLDGQDDAQVKLAHAQEALASFDHKNQKLAETISIAYTCYQELSNAITKLLAQSLKKDITFDGDLGEFTQALEGLRLETEAVAPAFAKGIQRKLAQVKAETVGAQLLVLAREHNLLERDKGRMSWVEGRLFENFKASSDLRGAHALQKSETEVSFATRIHYTTEALAQSRSELGEREEEFDNLARALDELNTNGSLEAIGPKAVLTQDLENAKGAIKLKQAEIAALEAAIQKSNERVSEAVDELANRAGLFQARLETIRGDILSEGAVYQTRIDLSKRDVLQLQSQLNVVKADLREASLETQEELSKLPPLETFGVDNPSLKLWATGQHRVEGIIAAIPSVVLKEEVPLADLEETVSVLQEREDSLIVTAQVTGKALDQAVAELNKAPTAEKAELEKAILVLEERDKAALTSVQVTSDALNKAKSDALAVKNGVAAKFKEVLAQAEAKGLFSLEEENALVPYELVVPVLLQELGKDFFADYSDQEIAAFVVKAVKSLSQKLGFNEAEFEQINSEHKEIKSKVTELEAELEKLAAEQKETIEAIRQAKRDSKISKTDIKETEESLVQLNDLKAFLDLNPNCCSTLESRQVELEVTLSALHLAEVELGGGSVEDAKAVSVLEKRLDEANARLVKSLEKSATSKGALEEAEEVVFVLEKRLRESGEAQAKALDQDDKLEAGIKELRRNPEGKAADKVEGAVAQLKQVLAESLVEEATVKVLIASAALEKAKVHLESCREKAEVARVLKERSEEIKLALSQDRKVLDQVLTRFNDAFGKALISSPAFLERPFTDAKLKACVEEAIAENELLIVNLQGERVGYREASFSSRTKLSEIEESTARGIKKKDALISRFEDLKEAKKAASTLKAKAYDFAFQFFGLPLSIAKALKLFCTTEAEPTPPRHKRKVHFEKKSHMVHTVPQKKRRAADASNRRDAEWLMDQLGLVSSPRRES